MWTRPVLCRLCECPVVNGGVRVGQLEIAKLSVWWHRLVGVEFVAEEDAIICQFCLWDARFEHDHNVGASPDGFVECDWWSGHDNDQIFYQHYYKEATIQPVTVEMDPKSFKESYSKLEKQRRAFKLKKQPFGVCDFCGKRLKYRSDTGRHIKIVHLDIQNCKCQFCTVTFANVDNRYEHSNTQLKEDIIQLGQFKYLKKMLNCILCSQRFKNFSQLIVHMRNQHSGQYVRCKHSNYCNRVFQTNEEMVQHVFEMKSIQKRNKYLVSKEEACIYCSHVSKNKSSLISHVKARHPAIQIKCKFLYCSQYFHTQAECDFHFEKKHRKREDEKIFQCLKCDFKTTFALSLKRHIINTHGEKIHMCPKCKKQFGSISDLKAHLRRVHRECKLCQHCKTEFKDLRKHQTQHECRKCHQILRCRKISELHKKICILNLN